MRKNKRFRGLTLIEMAVVAVVLGLLTTLVFAVVFSSYSAYTSNTRMGGIQERARLALDGVTREIRLANRDTLAISQANGSDQASFSISLGVVDGVVQWSTPILIGVQPSLVDANGNSAADDGRLARVQDGVTDVYCDYVKQGGFTLQRQGDRVEVGLVLITVDDRGRPLECPVKTSVMLRNKGS